MRRWSEVAAGHVDHAILQSTYLTEWYTQGFNTTDHNAQLLDRCAEGARSALDDGALLPSWSHRARTRVTLRLPINFPSRCGSPRLCSGSLMS